MWQANLEPVQRSNALGTNLMPNEAESTIGAPSDIGESEIGHGGIHDSTTAQHGTPALHQVAGEGGHLEAAT